jgi:hypothetical protein
MVLIAVNDPDRAQITRALDLLHAFDRALGEELEQTVPVERRSISELEREHVGRARAGQPFAQIRRAQPVTAPEQRIEAPQTAEAACHRDAGNRQRRVSEQTFGEQQAMRLRVLDRRHAQFALEHAP